MARSDVSGYGSPSQVSTALKQLCNRGLIVSLGQGFFAKSSVAQSRGKTALLALAKAKRAKAISKRSSKRPHLAKGLLGHKQVALTSVAEQVRKMAAQEGVVFVETYADRWAAAVTRLVGDEAQSDPTEDLLVALTRKGKLTPIEMVELMTKHQRALKHV
ncbi:hypothetical protein [Pseudomonas sp. CGJS7]|uniref:hypothetical protein n=1 Tax=Pseudomonas sp. CGJS7 TaxID=3109348 RepID=UPI003008FD9C